MLFRFIWEPLNFENNLCHLFELKSTERVFIICDEGGAKKDGGGEVKCFKPLCVRVGSGVEGCFNEIKK